MQVVCIREPYECSLKQHKFNMHSYWTQSFEMKKFRPHRIHDVDIKLLTYLLVPLMELRHKARQQSPSFGYVAEPAS